jgi:YHS domain-containing protein
VTRAILYLIAFVLVIGVARSVLGIIFKGVADLFSPASSDAASSPAPGQRIPTSDALKKDPVCGTFIGASTALHKTVGGATYYFCSAECRDKFRG